MEVRIARILSYLLHPLFVPTYFTLVLLNVNTYNILLIPYEARLLLLGLIFVITAVFPLVFILFMKFRGMIGNLQMKNRTERTIPFAVAGIFNFTASYMVKQIGIDDVFFLFLLGGGILITLCLIINFYFKISIHMAAIGGLTGALLGLSNRFQTDLLQFVLVSILVSGLVGYARLRLNAHRPYQVYSGFFCGLILFLIVIQF
jgi:hypothetical protein